jgi:hypothetical protein
MGACDIMMAAHFILMAREQSNHRVRKSTSVFGTLLGGPTQPITPSVESQADMPVQRGHFHL